MQVTSARERLAQEWLVRGVLGRRAHSLLVRARREVKDDDFDRLPRYGAQRPRMGRFLELGLLPSVLHAASS